MRLYDVGGGDSEDVVLDRVLTVPNVLSFARLLILPWLWGQLTAGTSEGLAWGLGIGFLFGITDWFDGYVARRFNQVSKLGKLLDPVSDRLFIMTVTIAMVVVGLLPLWPVILIALRDVGMLLGGLALLGGGRQPPPVTRLGKTATFGLMWSFPPLLASGVIGEPADPNPIWWWAGMVLMAASLVLYWATALDYVRTLLRERRDGTTPVEPIP